MSIFSSSPPFFSISEVKTISFKEYGLKVTVKKLDSDRDQNFHLVLASGNQFVLKIYNSDEDNDIIDLHTNVLCHLEKQQLQLIKTPILIKTLDKKRTGKIIKDNKIYRFRLVSYIKGTQLKDIKKNKISFYDLGSSIANILKILSSLEDCRAKRYFPWDVGNIQFVLENSSKLNDKNKEKLIDYYIRHYQNRLAPLIKNLRKGIIHNDYNDHNIIMDRKNNFKGVIDFGDMIYTYVSAEPAICIAYAILDSNKPFEVAADILKGFESIYHLSDEEIESVIYFSCMRLCISVVMANYRANLFPNNHYLMVSSEKAWRFLDYMYAQDLIKWSRDLVKYVRA